MVKVSDFPDGTIVAVDGEPFKREGDTWLPLDTSLIPYGVVYTGDELDTLQAAGDVAIMGIPYPVALRMAEWLAGSYTKKAELCDPENIILDAAKAI